MKTLLVIALFVASIATASADDSIDIVKGKFIEQDGIVTQLLSVTNHRQGALGFISVRCAFFREVDLLDTSIAFANNVEPGETVYMKISAVNADGADRTKCRISTIN
jgi:hypothetical protein